ncbi:hypothetical protein Tsp_13011, partial [Trichinella spiralis]|uniref:hypothetical protein n=1 Tax=Trichinella spiralis TaxID=6334 RepID=UPI0001EFDA5D
MFHSRPVTRSVVMESCDIFTCFRLVFKNSKLQRTDFYCGMEKIVTFKNLTYEALTAKAPGWRTFFKVKHSMELGFLKTTRSCCHYENFTYIFQLNHQQMSMKVCRQLEHCEQLKWCEKLGREDR